MRCPGGRSWFSALPAAASQLPAPPTGQAGPGPRPPVLGNDDSCVPGEELHFQCSVAIWDLWLLNSTV